jgi:hypothetical protein
MLQKPRDNLWGVLLPGPGLDHYTIGYKPLDEAGEMMSGDYEAVLELAATRMKVVHVAMVAADPAIYEFFHPCGRPAPTS